MGHHGEPVRFELLGPLRALRAGEELALGWPRQQATLAALLLCAGRVVERDELVDAVWGSYPPATAPNSVHSYVSRLRKVLEPDRAARAPGRVLASVGGGYLLHLAEGQLDMQVAERYLARARQARAGGDLVACAAALEAALGLWQGTPLAGVPGPLAEIHRARLTEVRLTAAEDHADTLLGMGRSADLVGGLAALAAQHPFREGLTGLLMRALYRGGRQAEALAAYQRMRRILIDELGVEPGPDLRRLHNDILNNADTADLRDVSHKLTADAAPRLGLAQTAVPQQLPTAVRNFTGRATALHALARLARESAAVRVPVISVVSGSGGVGKTALAIHFAHKIADRFPDGQLYVNLRGFGPAGAPTAAHEILRGFLDALAVDPERIPASLDALTGLYRSVLADRRVLLVLDNARDEAQVRPLLPGTGNSMVIITSRSQFTGLAATHDAVQLTIDVLTHEESLGLLTHRFGAQRLADDRALAAELIALCARLPLALVIAAARAAARPWLPLASLVSELRDAGQRLDALDAGEPTASVRTVLSWSYRQLTTPAARMFRLISLHPGPDIGIPVAASLAAVPTGQARAALTELDRSCLAVEHTPGRYAFHDLLRAYAAELAQAEDDESARRAAMYRTVDHYLHTAYAANQALNPHPDPLWVGKSTPGVTPENITAQDRALAWFTAERTALLACVPAADAAGFHAHAWQLAATLDSYLYRQGHWRDWAAVQTAALDAARRGGDRYGQASAHKGLAGALAELGRHADAEYHLQCALDFYGKRDDTADQTYILLNLAKVLASQERHAEALSHAEKALALSRTAGDRAGQAYALNAAGWLRARLGDYDHGLQACEQALALHEGGIDICVSTTWDSLGYIHHRLGHHQHAITCYQRAITLRREVGDRYLAAITLVGLGDVQHTVGNANAARRAWQQALTILDDLNHEDAGQLRAKVAASLRQPNRPNTGAASGVTSVVSPVRLNIRWIVRSSGAYPDCALRIRWTCAAVRAGFSFFSAAASASTSGGVRGWDRRGDGTSASNPPLPPRPDPHIQRPPGHPHRLPGRAGVLAGRDLPHHRAALA